MRAVRVTRVVAGTGGSPGSLATLRYAEELARDHNAILVPLLAWEPPCGNQPSSLQHAWYLRQEWQQIARQRMLQALLAVWGEEPPGQRIKPQVEQGPAGWVLVTAACQAGDVLVIGAGRRGWRHRIAGHWVSRYCTARARCPVILVPRRRSPANSAFAGSPGSSATGP